MTRAFQVLGGSLRTTLVKGVFVAVAFVASAPAFAEDWFMLQVVGTRPTRSLVLVDRETIARDTPRLATITAVILYEDRPREAITKLEIDCDSRLTTVKFGEIRTLNDDLIYTLSEDDLKAISLEDRKGKELFGIACMDEWPVQVVSYGGRPLSAIFSDWFGE